VSKELDKLRRLPKRARLDLLTYMTLERLVALTKESAQDSKPVQKVISIEKGKTFRRASEFREGNQ
jgi:hypothetical protein